MFLTLIKLTTLTSF